jgi:ABC-2 type transport system permease protein
MMHGFTAVFRKELTQMIRDRGTLFFALVIPVFELILFGVIDMNAKDIPTVVFDQSRTQESRLLIHQFTNTALLKLIGEVGSRRELQQAIVAGRAQVAIEIPPDYARNLAAQRTANVLVLVDGSDSSIANQAVAATNGVVLSQGIQDLIASTGKRPLIDARPVMLFNPDMRSANLLIPGLLAILLTFSGTILSAFAIVRERERGTLEQLMVTPVSPLAVVIGKLLPYLALAYIQLVLITLLMRFLFQVPIHGSVVLLMGLAPIYILALLSVGLIASARAKSQMEAMQRAMAVMLPSVLLSGYVFPLYSLPPPLKVIAYILPATYFIKICRAIVIRGAGFFDIWQSVAALVTISIVLITLSATAFRKTVS